MICKNCGNTVDNDVSVCNHCGAQIASADPNRSLTLATFIMGIIGLGAAGLALMCMFLPNVGPIFTFVHGTAAIVLSCLALKKAKQLKALTGELTGKAKTGYTLASIGLPAAIGVLALAVVLLAVALVILVMAFIGAAIPTFLAPFVSLFFFIPSMLFQVGGMPLTF